jgi:tetratricopeptide (TPR) repeat protein
MKKINRALVCVFCLVLSQVVFSQTTAPAQEAGLLRERALELYRQRKFHDALELARQIVHIKERELGTDHIEVARALYDAAIIEIAGGQLNEGERTLNKAIAIYESKTGLSAAEYVFEAQMFETLGFVKYKGEEFEKSIDAYRRAVELKEKNAGVWSLETSKTLWQLANVHLAKSGYKKAAELYARVAKIRVDNLEQVGTDDAYDALRRYECAIGKSEEDDKQTRAFIKETEAKIEEFSKKTIIKGGVVNSKALNLVRPPYPPDASRQRIRSKVEVLVTIDENGKVIFACAQKGHAIFYSVAEEAALRSRFTPTLINGGAAKVSGIIVYNFGL